MKLVNYDFSYSFSIRCQRPRVIQEAASSFLTLSESLRIRKTLEKIISKSELKFSFEFPFGRATLTLNYIFLLTNYLREDVTKNIFGGCKI